MKYLNKIIFLLATIALLISCSEEQQSLVKQKMDYNSLKSLLEKNPDAIKIAEQFTSDFITLSRMSDEEREILSEKANYVSNQISLGKISQTELEDFDNVTQNLSITIIPSLYRVKDLLKDYVYSDNDLENILNEMTNERLIKIKSGRTAIPTITITCSLACAIRAGTLDLEFDYQVLVYKSCNLGCLFAQFYPY